MTKQKKLKLVDDLLEKMERLANKTNKVNYQPSHEETQLIFVNDLLDKMEHLANNTNRVDYVPSYEETQKILQIKRYLDTIIKNIG